MEKVILVVDDEQDVAEAIASILEDEGYKVLLANNGKEALTLLEKQIPRLVITDVMMPYMDGLKLLECMKAKEQLREVPVVLMSAAPFDSGTAEARANLRKPFNMDKLLRTVEPFLRTSN